MFDNEWRRFHERPLLAGANAAALARLNPDKFYVENVRSVLGVSHRRALDVCETAVRRGEFRRLIDLLCPDGTVAKSVESESALPETVRCWIDEGGEYVETEFPTSTMPKVVAYRLND